MTSADRRIAALATGQLGAFTRAQANDAGLSHRQLRNRVQSGSLVQTGPNSFRIAGTPTTLDAELRATMLDVGGPVWVAGPTAAAVHGIDGTALRRPFHLLMPADRNVRRNGVVIHRSATIDPIDRAMVRDLPVTSPARTVIDQARTASPSQLDAMVTSAIQLGLTSEDQLYRRIGALRTRGRFGIPAPLGVLDRRVITLGAESWLEREYLRLLALAGLPRPVTQQVLTRANDRLVRVDCRFAGTNLVVELLGYAYHRTRDQMNRDAARLNALATRGMTTYQFTYDQVVGHPNQVVDDTRLALSRALPTAA